ncbi:TAP-like protein [Friedmanniella luteola]|uniref:TAP-like protein n=1 Tax=Friedmanniella luteola TaxID=546871 RepID=A0A1H1YTS9_9ACTN|nr:TAP-like protein [Friedmanniella luteola]
MAVLVGLALVVGGGVPALPAAEAAPTAATRELGPARVPARYLQQQVRWEPCDFDFLVRSVVPSAPETRCADVVVPMDWRHPDDHPDVTVAVALSLATGRSRGLLALNPGGPGLAALDATAFFATERPRMFRDFDLLGFDPRGYGRSTPATCRDTPAQRAALPTVADPRVRDRATHRWEVAWARHEARSCTGELTRFLGTQQTVDDLEFVRAYLQAQRPAGDQRYERLNYVGFSYGTWLGAWYADTYPGRTGRFLLDSNMDWTATMAANQAADSASFQRRRDQMFFPWVARHPKSYRLGRTPAAVRRSYERIRAGVQTSFDDGRSPAGAADLDRELLDLLYLDADFPEAAQLLLDYAALAEPAGADAVRRAAARPRPLAVRAGRTARPQADDDVAWEPLMAVRCNDSVWSRDVAAIQRRTDADARRHTFVGYWNSLTMCSYWPQPASTRTIDLTGAPTVLMVQSEGDPATGYEGALRAHRATAGRSRLVSVQDEGQHGVYLSGVSPCVERIGDAFLFSGVLPARDTVCATTPLPRERVVHPLAGPVTGRPTGRAAQTRSGGAGPAGPAVQRIRRAAAAAELG